MECREIFKKGGGKIKEPKFTFTICLRGGEPWQRSNGNGISVKIAEQLPILTRRNVLIDDGWAIILRMN